MADEPLPDNVETFTPPKRKRQPGPSLRERTRGKKKGRQPYLNDAQKEEVLAMFARGMSGLQIATTLGVSTATIYAVKNRWRKQSEGGGETEG